MGISHVFNDCGRPSMGGAFGQHYSAGPFFPLGLRVNIAAYSILEGINDSDIVFCN
jgi:hypothetical protein